MVRFIHASLLAVGFTQLSQAATNSTINSQLRLAYAGDTGMYVSWNTFEKLDNPTVHYGLVSNDLNMTASSNVSVTYATSLTYNNHVKISTGGQPEAFSVAVVVDLGTMGAQGLTTYAGTGVSVNNTLTPGEINTIQSLDNFKSGFDFLWHPGDLAYADYWLKEKIQGFLPNTTTAEGYHVYESILNDFYDELSPVTAVKPYMVGPGNHEANCDNGGYADKTNNITYNVSICVPGQTNFTGHRNHFRMPSAESGGTGNSWYSFNHGMTHFGQVDTETDLGHGFIAPDEPGGVEGEDGGPFNTTLEAQTEWLEADLAGVNRTETPWVIVAGHRPWYLSHANASGTICWTCKDVFEPLYIKYGVDLVLSGHAHVYERQNPLANGVIDSAGLNNPEAPWYITNGAAGHYDGLDALQYPLQDYSRFGLDTLNRTFGWSRLTFHNHTHLTHEFVASKTGEVLDLATLYKART
ncbi:Phosphodiesterase/alkaline phosphatase D [Exophiala viscosa]|uniref:Purple acid phosphatase n=1 Tax=Exophiala viscosa TaxID=2486360 RepID=A0AAN6DYD2_9EURO|nr:Phosphodiesterase/alkaline phosphatase D [Exophiala viscosa]